MDSSAVCTRQKLVIGAPWLVLLLLLAGACSPDLVDPPREPEALPLSNVAQTDQIGKMVHGRYIVVFRNSVTDAPGLAGRLTNAHGGRLGFTYQHALKGFSADLPDAAVAALRRNPNIEFVEPVTITSPGGFYSPPAEQTSAIWNLDRVDQRALPLSGTYSYSEDGAPVRIYVVDSGIDTHHPEFGGRAKNVADMVAPNAPNAVSLGTEGPCPSYQGDATGPNGHGTHVAGTAGGTKWGIAKNAMLLGVRVLHCNKFGTSELSIAGLDWVVRNAVKPAVVNFSNMHSASTAVDRAAQAVVANGLMLVTIATNTFQTHPETGLPYGGDACQWSPARISRVSDVITVAGSTSSDARASWSGYGPCVTLFAPGAGILSALPNNQSGTWRGTSMAAPHVSGVIARYLERNPTATVPQIKQWLLATATPGIVTDPMGSPNLLLYMGSEPPATPPPATLPPAAPSNLAATAVSSSSINLVWTDHATNETEYRVHRSTASGFTPSESNRIATLGTDATSYRDAGLVGSTTYYYQVVAANAAGTSASNQASAATPSAALPPAAPSNLAATAVSSSRIDIRWADNSGIESGFKIERAPDNAGAPGAYAEIAAVGANVTNYSNTGLSAGTKYWYRVRAHNAVGTSTYSNAANATTATASTLPPTGLSATGFKVKAVHHADLKWAKGSAATVDIWRNSVKVRSAISNAGSYTDNTGEKGGKRQYTYQVCVAGKTGSTNCSNAVTVRM